MIRLISKLFGLDKKISGLESRLGEALPYKQELEILRYKLYDGECMQRKADAEAIIMKCKYEIEKQEQRIRLLRDGFDIDNGDGKVRFVSLYTRLGHLENNPVENNPKSK